LPSKQAKPCCSILKKLETKEMNRPDGQTEIEIYMDKTKYYTVWNDKMGQSSCSARDVQVSVVALNDLLANL